MKLRELRHQIATSSADDWHRPVHTGGTTYRRLVVNDHRRTPDVVETWVNEHPELAVYEEDVDITIAWGLDPDDEGPRATGRFRRPEEPEEGDEVPDHHPDYMWLPRFPDLSTSSCIADVFYRGSLVDSVLLLHVDGARALLPMPVSAYKGDPPLRRLRPEDVEWRVSQWEVDLARLINEIGAASEFERYFEQTEYVVI